MDARSAAGNATNHGQNHQMTRQVSDMESIYEEMPAKGPYLYDVRKIFGFFDPLPFSVRKIYTVFPQF